MAHLKKILLIFACYKFDEDECLSSPCLNEGTCINEMASFVCLCKDGFQGESV